MYSTSDQRVSYQERAYQTKNSRKSIFITERDADVFQDVIQGMFTISSSLAKVLTDPGSTHSFASHEFVQYLNIEQLPLDYILIVSIRTNKDLTTSTVC